MKLTLIQPCIGRKPGEPYLRLWQMEPLAMATLAGLTPPEIDVRLVDDRLEPIPYDAPTDLVAMNVETYTAKRAYQIASRYRRRGVPVIFGGFHPTLCSDEAAEYAESVVVGEAEGTWGRVLDDFRHGRLEKIYRAEKRPSLAGLRPDRSIFRGRRYLSIGLVEAARGCRFRCDFCAVGAYFVGSQSWRPVNEVVSEMVEVSRYRKLIFLVDDNIGSEPARAKELFRALAEVRVRWVSQCSINVARDEEFVELMARSGCQGVLIGFESLSPDILRSMNKTFNCAGGGYDEPLRTLARHRVCVYGTFIFGYDEETEETFTQAVEFARLHRFYLAAFNHLVPFPGAPLYDRLQAEGRLLYEKWWLDDRYHFNDIAFRPARLSPADLRERCMRARWEFYSLPSILERACGPSNRSSWFMLRNFVPFNLLHHWDVDLRDHHPLGDIGWKGPLLRSASSAPRMQTPTPAGFTSI